MKDGGVVSAPQRVQDHFLAYINPQEAAMLQAMGGGVNPDGSQKMMNGVPSFNGDAGTSGASSAGAEASGEVDAKEAKEARDRDALDRGAEAAQDKAARDKAQDKADRDKARAAAQDKAGFGFGFDFGIYGEISEDPEDDDNNLKKGGEVKAPPNVNVPSNVRDHFLAYINPQEAAMLRAMGGGISAAGGQKMMNGIPSFNGEDVGGDQDAAEADAAAAAAADAAASDPFGGPSSAPSASQNETAAAASVGGPASAPGAKASPATETDLSGIMGFVTNPVASLLGFVGLPGPVSRGFATAAQVAGLAASVAMGNVPGVVSGIAGLAGKVGEHVDEDDFSGFDVEDPSNPDTEGGFGQ